MFKRKIERSYQIELDIGIKKKEKTDRTLGIKLSWCLYKEHGSKHIHVKGTLYRSSQIEPLSVHFSKNSIIKNDSRTL